MKEKIIEILNQNIKGLKTSAIMNELNISKGKKKKELFSLLSEMIENYDIYKTKKGLFIAFENSHLKKGELNVNKKGFGFLLVDEGKDIYIDRKNMNGALNKDIVVVELLKTSIEEKPEGRILKVIERGNSSLVGKIYYRKGQMFVDLDDEKLNIDVKISKGKTKGARADHKVIVKLKKEIPSLRRKIYWGEIVKIIGHKDDPGVDILSIVESLEIPNKFSNKVMKETENIPEEINQKDTLNRKDLRNEHIFTIDGDDAKDLDDAIRVQKLEDGNYLLGVYIADVSHYVKETSEIGKEAYNRGTSVYLVDRVIPMLPHILSNGICSLNEGVDRLVLAVDMIIDNDGNLLSYEIFEGVINSKKRMTYKNANRVLNDEKVIGYEEFKKDLNTAYSLSKIIREKKEKNGNINFETEEPKIIVDGNGKPIKILKRERGIAERIIEDFMIIANETVAKHLNDLNVPSLYRIHGKPKQEKTDDFMAFISHLGYVVQGENKINNSKQIQSILAQLKTQAKEEEFEVITDLMLRTMEKAIYSEENIGHFGLGSKYYTHFTSPIRRFPDLTIHRLLRNFAINKNSNISSWESKLVEVAEQSSMREVRAVNCERKVDDMKMAEYMSYNIGKEYEGTVSGVTNFGLFIKLPNLVEGLVHISTIKDDHYIYDKNILSLVGTKTKKEYRIGMPVKIKVIKASKELSIIDFELVE